MRLHYNLFGTHNGYVLSLDEMNAIRRLARRAPACKAKFEVLAMLRESEGAEYSND